MVKIQTDLNNFSVSDQLLMLFAPMEQSFSLTIQAGAILPEIINCPFCNNKLAKNGYNRSQNRQANAFGLSLKKGRLICTNPGCNFYFNLPQAVFGIWFSKLSNLLESIMLSLKTKKLSSEEIAQHIKEIYNLPISNEYIRIKLKEIMKQTNKPMPIEKPSGVIVHDEQFVKIKGIDLKRISAIDANNLNVYHDQLYENRTAETTVSVCHELKKLVDKLRAVVIDGLTASKKAYTEEFVDILV